MNSRGGAVAILIVHHNTSDVLLRCISALPEHAWPDVAVFDAGSTADEKQRAESELGSRVGTWINGENLGFAGGLNVLYDLLKDRGYDRFLLLNPDAQIGEQDLELLVETAWKERLDLCSPTIAFPTSAGLRVWWGGGHYNPRRGRVEHLHYGHDVSDLRLPAIVDVDFVSGAVLLIAAAAMAELFPLDESYFLYWEDVRLSIEANRRGLRMAHVTRALAVHEEGASSNGTAESRSPLFYYYVTRNRYLLCRDVQARRSVSWWVECVLNVGKAFARESNSRRTVLKAVTIGEFHGLRGRRGRWDRAASL